MRVAIIGSGVSGLVAAHRLHPHHDVTVFEADSRLGGHANTVRVDLNGRTHWVDTGFLVYNERNYPGLVRLLDDLDIRTQSSDMSFSVSDPRYGLEWRSTNLSTLFAQRRRALDPRFLAMLRDVVRFNRAARSLIRTGPADPDFSLDDLLDGLGCSTWFRDWYLIPMGASIWSADPGTFTRFPAATFAHFFDNHGLLSLGDRPQWRTITGGARHYVEAVARPLRDRIHLSTPVVKVTRRDEVVEVITASGDAASFDKVVIATHSDQALELLSDPTAAEREILGAIRYQPNEATLHTDETLLPRTRRAWAAWNYHVPAAPDGGRGAAMLTYHLNTLQSIDATRQLCVTLNRPDAPRADTVVENISYAHPVLDAAAVRAQRRRDEINGVAGTYFCGAYWGYGFHEDGVQSALEVVRDIGAST